MSWRGYMLGHQNHDLNWSERGQESGLRVFLGYKALVIYRPIAVFMDERSRRQQNL